MRSVDAAKTKPVLSSTQRLFPIVKISVYFSIFNHENFWMFDWFTEKLSIFSSIVPYIPTTTVKCPIRYGVHWQCDGLAPISLFHWMNAKINKWSHRKFILTENVVAGAWMCIILDVRKCIKCFQQPSAFSMQKLVCVTVNWETELVAIFEQRRPHGI